MAKTNPVEEQPKKQQERDDTHNRGDCDLCGEWASRLVDGVCGSCRTLYRIK